MSNAEYDEGFWGGKIVDGHWEPNLSQLEDSFRKGLDTFRDQGPMCLHFTYFCDSQDVATRMAEQLRRDGMPSVEMVHYGDSVPPSGSLARSISSIPGANPHPGTVRVLSNPAGWRVRFATAVIDSDSALVDSFRVIRQLEDGTQWHMESCGLGPSIGGAA
jgi:hypothetical protein